MKAPYVPYAENLRHVLQTINGHLIAGYTAGGDAQPRRVESELLIQSALTGPRDR
jgi:hypothetical protein